MNYKVYLYLDDVYQVVDIENNETKYQGNLSDCESWIRLKEKGYL